MPDNASELISKAKGTIIRQQPFFASLLLSMATVEAKHRPIDTAATDGKKIFYNVEWIEKLAEDLNNDGRMGVAIVLLHEVIHAAFGHVWRGSGRNSMLWNVAADLVTNDIIKQICASGSTGMKIPSKLTQKILMDDKISYSTMSVEEVYADLLKNCQNKKCPLMQGQKGQGNGSGQKQDGGKEKGDGSGKEQGDGKEPGDGGKEPGNGSGDCDDNCEDGCGDGGGTPCKGCKGYGVLDDHSIWSEAQRGADAEATQTEWECKVSAAAEAERERIIKNQGTMPAWMSRLVKEIEEPKIDWRRVLANFIQPTKSDYDWTPPDRRFSGMELEYGFDIILPDINGDSIEDIVIAVDTSGSIDGKLLKEFLSEVIGIVQMWPSIHGWMTSCDAALGPWFEISEDTTLKDMNISGGGGTDFRPVFNEIENRSIKPTALIYLTDTWGSYPEEAPDYPTMWVVPKEYKDNMSAPPFGSVLLIED